MLAAEKGKAIANLWIFVESKMRQEIIDAHIRSSVCGR